MFIRGFPYIVYAPISTYSVARCKYSHHMYAPISAHNIHTHLYIPPQNGQVLGFTALLEVALQNAIILKAAKFSSRNYGIATSK